MVYGIVLVAVIFTDDFVYALYRYILYVKYHHAVHYTYMELLYFVKHCSIICSNYNTVYITKH